MHTASISFLISIKECVSFNSRSWRGRGHFCRENGRGENKTNTWSKRAFKRDCVHYFYLVHPHAVQNYNIYNTWLQFTTPFLWPCTYSLRGLGKLPRYPVWFRACLQMKLKICPMYSYRPRCLNAGNQKFWQWHSFVKILIHDGPYLDVVSKTDCTKEEK